MSVYTVPHKDLFNATKLRAESEAIAALLQSHGLNAEDRVIILENAKSLLNEMRLRTSQSDISQSLFQEVDMGKPEGLALISLAEALLRVPDDQTAELLLQEKLSSGDWEQFRTDVNSPKLKALGYAVGLASRFIDVQSPLFKATGAVGLPAVRFVTQRMMQFMATRFVFAPTIESALSVAAKLDRRPRFSFDMLGEGARTMEQARAFCEAYTSAIMAIGRAVADKEPLDQPSISVKLSALHPRFEIMNIGRLRNELIPTTRDLAILARSLNVPFTIDAEEADRLEITLEIFSDLARLPELKGWNGLGLAVQAYSKRTPQVIEWIDELGRESGRSIPVRLVKGAYWDAEIKHAQTEGLADYPVYTNKAATDVSYISCAQLMLASDHIIAQFATHNAHTVAAILRIAGAKPFEFQRLHGMGEQLYNALASQSLPVPVRVYAPVGQFKELLPYLIRRMLENTANTSFVRTALDSRQPLDLVIQDPITTLENHQAKLRLPEQIYGDRKNSVGTDLADVQAINGIALSAASKRLAMPVAKDGMRIITNPAQRRNVIGIVHDSETSAIGTAITVAKTEFTTWNSRPVYQRCEILERTASLLEENAVELAGLIVVEAGRSIEDAVAEVREAVDFCRYYAQQARQLYRDITLPGITGERNVLRLRGRGVFACVSPWNFPLAIFVGQVAAAIVTGNTVVAKPSPQTPLIAQMAVSLFRKAGLPESVLQLVQGASNVGNQLTSDERIAGVAFTGSTSTARNINRALAMRNGPIGVLIAETGGINAMFVDASALLEQVVDDVITSGFMSAGQRCSSLRHLFVQDDIADQLIEMISGAMDVLRVGDPANPATDIGPVIDANVANAIQNHIETMKAQGARIVKQTTLGPECAEGTFVAPTLIELSDPSLLQNEVFGPVVHISRWRIDQLDDMLNLVRNRGYGLTLGVHSRITRFADTVKAAIPTGNTYINRNTVGAVVGAQPFGGCGLSGTGPKAGGPHYLLRFATEEVITTNLTAVGGDVALLTS